MMSERIDVTVLTPEAIDQVIVDVFDAPVVVPPPDVRRYWRVLHDYEIWKKKFTWSGHGQFYHEEGWDWRNGMPEVFWLFDGTATEITQNCQELIKAMNPNTTMKKLRVAFDWMRAFTNGLGKGFDTKNDPQSSDYVPLRDHFTNSDLDAPYPRFDKIRLCGGATVRGVIDGDYLVVEHLTPDNIPSLEWMNDHPWLRFRALSTHNSGGKPTFSDFQQGNGYPLMVPLVSKNDVRFPLGALEEVDGIADPFEVKL